MQILPMDVVPELCFTRKREGIDREKIPVMCNLFAILALAFCLIGCDRADHYQVLQFSDRVRDVLVGPEMVSKPAIKVFLIVDNSNSMEWNQQNLALATEKLLGGLENSNMEFFIYTATTPTANARLPQKSSVGIDLTEYSYLDASGAEVVSPTLPPNTFEYKKRVRYGLNAPANVPLKIRMGMPKTEFDSVKQAIKDAVLAVGASGNNKESGLCPMAAILNDDKLKLIQPGDKAVFMILTDADDYASLAKNNCYQEYVSDTKVLPTTRYRAAFGLARVVEIKYPCQKGLCTFRTPIASNQFLPQFTPDVVNTLDWTCPKAPTSCMDTSYAPLINAFATHLKINPQGIRDCTYSCEPRSTSPYASLADDEIIYLDTDPNQRNRDLCTDSFTRKNVIHQNLYDYVSPRLPDNFIEAGSCSKGPQEYVVTDGNTYTPYTQVFSPATPVTLHEAMKEKLEKVVGEGNYSVVVFAHDMQVEKEWIDSNQLSGYCTQSQAEGVEYRKWVNTLGPSASLYPICANDYSVAMNNINRWIKNIYSLSEKVELKKSEELTGVFLKRKGELIALTPQDYTYENGKVTIRYDFPFEPGDEISLSLQSISVPGASN